MVCSAEMKVSLDWITVCTVCLEVKRGGVTWTQGDCLNMSLRSELCFLQTPSALSLLLLFRSRWLASNQPCRIYLLRRHILETGRRVRGDVCGWLAIATVQKDEKTQDWGKIIIKTGGCSESIVRFCLVLLRLQAVPKNASSFSQVGLDLGGILTRMCFDHVMFFFLQSMRREGRERVRTRCRSFLFCPGCEAAPPLLSE